MAIREGCPAFDDFDNQNVAPETMACPFYSKKVTIAEERTKITAYQCVNPEVLADDEYAVGPLTFTALKLPE